MMQCLFDDELILSFCYSDLTLETGGFELASTITLVLQANRLKTLSYRTTQLWTLLPEEIKQRNTKSLFKSDVKHWICN